MKERRKQMGKKALRRKKDHCRNQRFLNILRNHRRYHNHKARLLFLENRKELLETYTEKSDAKLKDKVEIKSLEK